MSNDESRIAGEDAPSPRGVRVKGVVWNLAMLGMLFAVAAILSRRPVTGRPNGGGAALSCASFVRERLPVPSTARFEQPQDVKVGRLGADWTVEGLVAADDSAGVRASIRYNCVLRAEANDDWHLVDLSLYRYRF